MTVCKRAVEEGLKRNQWWFVKNNQTWRVGASSQYLGTEYLTKYLLSLPLAYSHFTYFFSVSSSSYFFVTISDG